MTCNLTLYLEDDCGSDQHVCIIEPIHTMHVCGCGIYWEQRNLEE